MSKLRRRKTTLILGTMSEGKRRRKLQFNLISELNNLFLLQTIFACVEALRPVVRVPSAPSELRREMQKLSKVQLLKKSATVGGNRKNPQFTRSNKDMTMTRGHMSQVTTTAIKREI